MILCGKIVRKTLKDDFSAVIDFIFITRKNTDYGVI